MPTREAEANWTGDLQSGRGHMHIPGGLDRAFDLRSRMEGGEGTNPEELIGAAHAGCFSMALAAQLEGRGLRPERIHTRARVHFGQHDGAWTIDHVDLETEAVVRGLGPDELEQEAQAAKLKCPVSRALEGVEIGLSARLIEPS